VLSEASLVLSSDGYSDGGPGFDYITGSKFYSLVQWACPVPATTAGKVRISMSANGFSGNERATDPTGGAQPVALQIIWKQYQP